jgi:hypothetical protein
MLFDSSTASSGHIYQYTDLDVKFPCATHHSIQFLLTTLDQSTHAVLGYLWLLLQNLLIDWIMHQLTFCLSLSTGCSCNAFCLPIMCVLPELSMALFTLGFSRPSPGLTTHHPRTIHQSLCFCHQDPCFCNWSPSSPPQMPTLWQNDQR